MFKEQRSPLDSSLLNKPNDLPFKEIQQGERAFQIYVGKQIVIRKVNEEWLQVWIPFNKKGWIDVVKEISGRHWNIASKSWVIPYVKDSLKRMWKQIGPQYIQYNFEINPEIPDAFKTVKKENKRFAKLKLNSIQQKAVIAFKEKMLLENKAWRTIKTYKGLFSHFLAYFPNTRPS